MLIKFGRVDPCGDKEITYFNVSSLAWLQYILQDELKRSTRILALVKG